MENQSFFLARADSHHMWSALRNDIESEVAIVGGGLTGVTCAAIMDLIGFRGRIVILERGRLASGTPERPSSTGASLGLVDTTTPEGLRSSTVEAREALRVQARGWQLMLTLVERFGLYASVTRCRSLMPAFNTTDLADLRKFAKFKQHLALSADDLVPLGSERLLSGRDLHAVGFPGNPVGLYMSNHDGKYDPVRFVRGLAHRLIERGKLQVYEETAVRAIERRKGALILRTDKVYVRAQFVVNATNVFALELVLGLLPAQRFLVAREAYCAALEVDNFLHDPNQDVFWQYKWPYDYGRMEGKVLVIGGSNERPLPLHRASFLDPEFEKHCVDMEREITTWANVSIYRPIARWSGLYALTPNHTPVVQEDQSEENETGLPGLFHVVGCGGTGMVMVEGAERVARIIVHRSQAE